jgi:hypothetical protein
MVHVDFDQIENCDNFASVPNGTYVCYVGEIRTRRGDDGIERWSLRWIVGEGPYAGRTAAWDSLNFSGPGLRRAKLILQKLDVPVEGPREIETSMLEGRRALVTVYAQERVDAATGRKVISNRVPFAGVDALDQTRSSPTGALAAGSAVGEAADSDDDIDF